MNALMVSFNVIFLIATLVVAWLYRTYYPKGINELLGYRTKRSMASKEQWLFANEFCSRVLFYCASATCLLQVILFLLADAKTALLTAIFLWMICLIATIVLTEYKLRKRF